MLQLALRLASFEQWFIVFSDPVYKSYHTGCFKSEIPDFKESFTPRLVLSVTS